MIYQYKRILELKYVIEPDENAVRLGEAIKKLNELGRNGWRIISVETMEGGIAYILERQITEDKCEES